MLLRTKFSVMSVVFCTSFVIAQTSTVQLSPNSPPTWAFQPKLAEDIPQNNLTNDVEVARAHKFHRNFISALDAQGAPNIGSRTYVTHINIPPIPADASDTIVIASPTQNQPYFAEGHTSVYTDLSLAVERYLFRATTVPENATVSILYSGGAIKNSRGEISATELASGSTPLQLGHKYLLFLNYQRDTQSYEVMRAWDLSAQRPMLLDQNGGTSPLNAKLDIPTLKDLEAQVASKIAASSH